MNEANCRNVPEIFSHTGLRGLAAFVVYLTHLYDLNSVHWSLSPTVFRFFYWGNEAVDFFFILSGFILNYVYLFQGKRIISWKKYFIARFARIAPLYYLTLFPMLFKLGGFSELFLSIPKYAYFNTLLVFGILFANLAMISGLWGDWRLSLNPPAWSISIEMVLYITAFPILVFLKPKFKGSLAMLILSFIFVLGMFVCHETIAFIPQKILGWKWMNVGRGVFGFSLGFMLCTLFQMQKEQELNNTNRNLRTKLLKILLLYLLFPFLYLSIIYKIIPTPFIVFAFPTLIYYSARDTGVFAKLLKLSLFQWMGHRSYSLYLWHFPVLIWYSKLIGLEFLKSSQYGTLMNIFLLTFFLLLISSMSYSYVEMPARNYLRRLGDNIRIPLFN